MEKDYSTPVLSGPGDTDYARYMRTDELLDLQRRPNEMIHRDELLFQIVHQSTELWLKLAVTEIVEATDLIGADEPPRAELLLHRAAHAVRLVTEQLEMLHHLAPADFQVIRPVLGHGSGFESPGWRRAQSATRALGRSFHAFLDRHGVDLATLYAGSAADPVYRLAEAIIEWDERISLWRVRHYKVATRIIGHDVIGTKGTPVEVLAKLVGHRFFPELWQVRTGLTEHGPLGGYSKTAG